ncbi:MAG: Wzz/FepE/Etk N-terminal domain-containing protein [Nevskia sp.]
MKKTEDATIYDLFGAVWQKRFFVLSGMIAGAILGAALAFSIPAQYESTVILLSTAENNSGALGGGISSVLAQIGGTSALSDLSLSGRSQASEALATLQSRKLTEAYISEKKLLPIFFSPKWDNDKGTWRSKDESYAPTLWQANALFDKNIRRIVEDKKSGTIKLIVTWTNPNLAAEWANDLVFRANQYLRDRAIQKSNQNLAYLNGQLARTSVVELQQSIYKLIENEIKAVMVAQGNDEYAFKIIDPAVPAEKKSKPDRLLIIICGILLGLSFTILVTLFRSGMYYESRHPE